MGISRGKGLWKFSKSLCDKSNFVSKLKYHLKVISNTMSSEQITAEQLFRSEVYKIWNKKIFYSFFKKKKMPKDMCQNCAFRE